MFTKYYWHENKSEKHNPAAKSLEKLTHWLKKDT